MSKIILEIKAAGGSTNKRRNRANPKVDEDEGAS